MGGEREERERERERGEPREHRVHDAPIYSRDFAPFTRGERRKVRAQEA